MVVMEGEPVELDPELMGFEKPVGPNYEKREVLATIEQKESDTLVEIVRYTWRDDVAKAAGHKTCIRIRRRWLHPGSNALGSESMGVPEHDWPALLTAIIKVGVPK